MTWHCYYSWKISLWVYPDTLPCVKDLILNPVTTNILSIIDVISVCSNHKINSISSSSNFIPNRKQSTAYMSKDTSVNQYTLMFCWWSPEKPKAYLAGNQKSGRDRLSAGAADQINGFMNPREWPAQPSSGDRLHQRARQPPAVRTDPLEHNSLQVRTHHRQPQGPARVPHPQKGPNGPLPRIPRLCPLHQRTAERTGQLNIWAESWGAGLRGEYLKQLGLMILHI